MRTPRGEGTTLGWSRRLLPQDDQVGALRAARLAALLFTLGGAEAISLAPSADTHATACRVTGAVAVVTGLLWRLLPWARWPRWTSRAAVLWAYVLMGAGLGAAGGRLASYDLIFALVGLYLGLTEAPLPAVWISAGGTVVAVVAVAGAEPRSHLPTLLIGALVGAALAWLLSRAHTGLRAARGQTSALLHALTALVAVDSDADAAGLLAAASAQVSDADTVLVLLRTNPRAATFSVVARHGGEPGIDGAVLDTGTVATGVGAVLRTDRPLWSGDARQDRRLDRAAVDRIGAGAVFLAPLPGTTEPVGVLLCAWDAPRSALPEETVAGLALLAEHTGPLIERLWRVARLGEQAQTDPLTGLGNRRALRAALPELPVGGAVLFLDLDHFKRYNDAHGHAAGDVLLHRFAGELRRHCRAGDVVARYGGEEFVVLIDSAASAHDLFARLRRSWRSELEPLTFSAGLAVRQPAESPDAALARADAALYRAKSGGRDQLSDRHPPLTGAGHAPTDPVTADGCCPPTGGVLVPAPAEPAEPVAEVPAQRGAALSQRR